MSYKQREAIGTAIEKTTKKIRFHIRRKYLRYDIKKFHIAGDKLTKQQVKEAEEYWSKYTKHFTPLWHQFYLEKNGRFDKRFVPEDLMMTDIEGYLNDWQSAHGIDNKNNYAMYFPQIRHPYTVFHKIRGDFHNDDYALISKEEAIENCKKSGNVIFKNALEAGKGTSIRFWRTEDGEQKLRQLLDSQDDDVIAQEFIEQCQEFADINPSSVNSVRIVTLQWKEQIHVLAAYLRMGNPGVRIDNVCAGGYCCGINPDGTLMKYGLNKAAEKIYQHPGGFVFDGYHVPSYDKIVAVAKSMHERIGSFHIVSWDIAVAPDGEPIFIEMNLKYGAMEYHQVFNGPLFGDLTDEILDKVYGK